MNADLLYAWAVAYHQAGWCVVPARNKVPLISWKEYQTKRPSLHQVRDWFAECPDDAQIALITGSISGVTVVDIDTHKENCAGKRKKPCDCTPEDANDILRRLPFSLTSKTGSGGYHIFYKVERSIKNSVKFAHPQLDVRSNGGIIILPPSCHDRTKKPYKWSEMYPWNLENLKALREFPKELKLQLIERPKTNWNDIVSGVGTGRRNATLTALIGKLLPTFGQEYLHAVWELAWLWNIYRNSPPLSQREFERTFKSIVESEYAKRGKK